MMNLLLIVLFIIITAISKSIRDKINFHYEKSIFSNFKNQKWWNPQISWKNKYKDCDETKGRSFIGSKTWLVFITDAWHFFESLQLFSFFVSIILAFNFSYDLKWYWYILIFIFLKLIYSATFELFWSKILIYKRKN